MKYESITDGCFFYSTDLDFHPSPLPPIICCLFQWLAGRRGKGTNNMCAYHHPDHCCCMSNSLPFALSAFCLYPAHSVNTYVCVSSACIDFSWTTHESKAANMILTTQTPLIVSLREICPANRLVQKEQRQKKSSVPAKNLNKTITLPSGTSVQEILVLESRLFGDKVKGKKEKMCERAEMEDGFSLLQLSSLLSPKIGVVEESK